ncbi:GNAT family N-acetyltransferase [Prevotella sp. 10(H)]|uniref:GNAT family N-acetyltransferase n=1 Tax=Prevotella sp. 10(H) TaxID=1158294 RepID=UPI0004A762CC|nr:GNAT family N-acetyltransferase [Prevotella sp. 10(H)]
MEIYKATINDLEDLIKLRIDFLKIDRGFLTEEEEKAIRFQLKKYFEKYIPEEKVIAVIARTDENIIASSAFLIIQEMPANPTFLTGITGTLLNVITYPEFRRKGIATKIIHYIIDEAKKMNVSNISLLATEDGKELYEKLGFEIPHYTNMSLTL